MIVISIAQQRLYHLDENHHLLASYSVSTAVRGVGQDMDSYQTPLGLHMVSELYGHDQPVDAVYVGRRATGERYSEALAVANPERDWILSRIIRLSGLETGYNRGGSVDTHARYIYIHGCPDSCAMGVPLSHGCIRMRNQEIATWFPQVGVGELVYITESNWEAVCLADIQELIASCTLQSAAI
jgi:L,D-transpeptidase YbiS